MLKRFMSSSNLTQPPFWAFHLSQTLKTSVSPWTINGKQRQNSTDRRLVLLKILVKNDIVIVSLLTNKFKLDKKKSYPTKGKDD